MRYPAAEKLEIIRLVEQSHLSVRRTLAKIGISPTTFYCPLSRFEVKPLPSNGIWPLGLCEAAGCADRQHFGVGGGVVKFAGAVSGRRDDLAVLNHHGPNGDFPAQGGHAGLVQGGVHEGFEHRTCPLAVERIVCLYEPACRAPKPIEG